MRWIIFRCYRCRLPLYAEEGQKTKKCPGCNKIINLKIVKKIKFVDDIQTAREIIMQLKAPKDVREEIIKTLKRPVQKTSKLDELINIIKELSLKSDSGFTIDDLKNNTTHLDLDISQLEEILEKFLKEGYIYQKSIGHYKYI